MQLMKFVRLILHHADAFRQLFVCCMHFHGSVYSSSLVTSYESVTWMHDLCVILLAGVTQA